MTPATLALVERLARRAAAMAGEPNSEPTELLTASFMRFWADAMEHAAGIADDMDYSPDGAIGRAIREAGK